MSQSATDVLASLTSPLVGWALFWGTIWGLVAGAFASGFTDRTWIAAGLVGASGAALVMHDGAAPLPATVIIGVVAAIAAVLVGKTLTKRGRA